MDSGGASQNSSSNNDSFHQEATSQGGASGFRSQLPPCRIWTRDHITDLIIGNPKSGLKTRSATQNECLFHNFLSQQEPKKVEDAHKDADWVTAMQEELN